MLLHSFHQSIAHLNDSSNFESSFEVKYIPTTTAQNLETRCLSQSDREALMRFVQEFEALQTYNSSAKSTPKKSPYRGRRETNFPVSDSIISGNTTARSLTQSPEGPPVIREHIATNLWSSDGDFLMDYQNNGSLSSTRSNSPVFLRSNMGCKSLTCCEYAEGVDEDGVELMGSNQNSSADSSFDLQPPLLPTFHVTPPPKSSRSAAYELAKFLRGSFHVKRAKITPLQRSVSVHATFQNNQPGEVMPKAPVKPNDIFENEAHTKELVDTTNPNNGNSICTRIFPNNTSPFRRVWEQSSLRSPRSDKYTLSPQQSKNSEQRSSTSMIASDNDVFLGTVGKDLAQRHHILPLRTHSEKVTTSNPRTKSPRVDAWGISFEHLLEDAAGLATFAEFLKMEFSAENIYFWTSCERYRTTESLIERQVQAKQIFTKYLSCSSSEPVNLDAHTRNVSDESLQSAEKNLFERAQKQIFHLMKFDSYQRFVRSDLYKNCQNAEAKNQPLPYGAENLDVLLKTNFLQSASPKLKKLGCYQLRLHTPLTPNIF